MSGVRNPEDFEPLLPITSLMNPKESKEAVNLNRIKNFNENDFIQEALENECVCVKLICTQPFNKVFIVLFVDTHIFIYIYFLMNLIYSFSLSKLNSSLHLFFFS